MRLDDFNKILKVRLANGKEVLLDKSVEYTDDIIKEIYVLGVDGWEAIGEREYPNSNYSNIIVSKHKKYMVTCVECKGIMLRDGNYCSNCGRKLRK